MEAVGTPTARMMQTSEATMGLVTFNPNEPPRRGPGLSRAEYNYYCGTDPPEIPGMIRPLDFEARDRLAKSSLSDHLDRTKYLTELE